MVLKRYLLEELSISLRGFLAVFLLLFNALTWTFITAMLFRTLELRSLMANLNITAVQHFTWAIFHSSIAGSVIIGGMLSGKIGRLHLLYVWTLLGGMATLLPTLYGDIGMDYLGLFCLALGSTIGVGLPSCLACLADSTRIEERGRVSGVLISAIALVSSLAVPLQLLGLAASFIVLAVWRFFGLSVLQLKSVKEITVEKGTAVSFSSVLHNRFFLLYLIPWIMFCLVDRTVVYVLQQYYELGFFWVMRILEPLVGVISAVIGGVLLDWVGRRRVTIFSFTVLGVAYAVIGFAPLTFASWLVYSVLDGFAWGALTVTFTLTLWADLSPVGASEKYYAVGSVPSFIAGAVGSFLAPMLTSVPLSKAFSWACLFLFGAVLPLWFAPETVPENVFERREFRSYIKKAKEVLRKYD